jgi:hypothetical protein
MEKLLCPHCETELEIIASGEPEFASDCYVPCWATCPDCGRTYKAFEVYSFVGYEELEEET